jgi:hypothetical protein
LNYSKIELARYLAQDQQFSAARDILRALLAQTGPATLNQLQLAEVLVGMTSVELGLGHIDSARAWLNKSLPQVARVVPADSRLSLEIQALSAKLAAAAEANISKYK